MILLGLALVTYCLYVSSFIRQDSDGSDDEDVMLPLPVKKSSQRKAELDESDAAKDEFDVSSSDDGGSFQRKTEVKKQPAKKLGPTMAKEVSIKAKGISSGDWGCRETDLCGGERSDESGRSGDSLDSRKILFCLLSKIVL